MYAWIHAQIRSDQSLSHVWLFATPWTAARQASLSITNFQSLLKLMSIESLKPSNHLILSSPSTPAFKDPFPESGSFQMSQFFTSVSQSIGVSASASVLPMNVQGWFPLGLTGVILQSKRRESSPTPQFKSINSSVLRLLYDPIHTSIHDYWKNHSFGLAKNFVPVFLYNGMEKLEQTFWPSAQSYIAGKGLKKNSTLDIG